MRGTMVIGRASRERLTSLGTAPSMSARRCLRVRQSMIVVLIGPHGVGKTTLGHALSEVLGWPFHEEIGRWLAADPAFRPDARQTFDPQPAFDRAVFAQELARDRLYRAAHGEAPRIVETWHPGNLAYAWERSPGVALEALRSALEQVEAAQVVVLPLVATTNTLYDRQTLPGSLASFHAVASRAVWLARGAGATIHGRIRTDTALPLQIARDLARGLELHARHAPRSFGARARADRRVVH